MDFFNKLGKKASEAYKTTADKTGKIAKETKLKFRMGELKSKIEDIYEEIGKKVYEKHVKNEGITENDVLEECKQIDEMSNKIEKIRQECLDLKDRKQCSKCFKEIDKNVKFCPECGAKQEEEEVKEVEILEKPKEEKETVVSETSEYTKSQPENNEEVQEETTEVQTNLEKTTVVEINPNPQNITEEEMKNIGQ